MSLAPTPPPEEPAMPLSHLPACLASAFCALGRSLDPRTAARVPLLLMGLLFASGRRTCTTWFRAGGLADEFRPAYGAIWALGRGAPLVALPVLQAVRPLLPRGRLLVGIDDTPTARWGPEIEGAGL